jgi:hypothetical protein
MRKSVLLLAVVAAMAAPGAALAKSAKVAKPRVVSTTVANQNELSRKVVADAVRQFFVPLEVTIASLK